MKIAFHDNAMSLFGTTLALYNWAYWGRKYLDMQPIIMYNSNHVANNISVIDKFKNTFNNKVFSYSNHNQIDIILSENECEYFLWEKVEKQKVLYSKLVKI